jgi:membrane protease subunit HflK
VTETKHTRARRASLGGLFVQVITFVGLIILGMMARSVAMQVAAWYVLGGVPLWFVALLIFRQRELAALEAMDLEELRREKESVGGEALFEQEGGGGLGFRVAEARLQMMQRLFVPGFALATAIYLLIMAILLWRGIDAANPAIGAAGWRPLAMVPVSMVVIAILMLGTFLMSRYTSGMGRVPEWQLLRGCGSYMLGNALALIALLVCLGVYQYAGIATWEQTLAFVLPVLMAVLAFEIIANFVLDIYRPREAGAEPRAAFDSRLLGLLAEPGGIASSIAEAINYQFGFQVSHTWFYKLLERAFLPLAAGGALALWLLTCIVVVQPQEHVVVTQWGRQLNADDPWGPGLHFKWPAPIEVAHPINTGQLQQISVGFATFDAEPEFNAHDEDAHKRVLLWTDDQHYDLDHFDFLIVPSSRRNPDAAPAAMTAAEFDAPTETRDLAVNLIRMEVEVQYRIRPDRLAAYTQQNDDPHHKMRLIAWEEVGRVAASHTVDGLLGPELPEAGATLKRRIDARAAELGLEVVYVGLVNVHPEKTVAEAYREVIRAEQEKVAKIREAIVTENQRLSAVAGDRLLAERLARAIDRARAASARINETTQELKRLDLADDAVPAAAREALEPLLRTRIAAEDRLEQAQAILDQRQLDLELGLGRTTEEIAAARERVDVARAGRAEAEQALDDWRAGFAAGAGAALSPAAREAVVADRAAHVSRQYWEDLLARDFTQTRMRGEAAAVLAQALAERWQIEMQAAAEVVRAENEREAYNAAPEVYKARRLTEVLVEGIADARKFFLAFDPTGRQVRVRINAEEEPGTDPLFWQQPDTMGQ